ncbi:Transcription initiation factor TFIID subunit 5 [Aphelenchoides besseyi]|nr:Transcription initiation factor TFIID subunit 5 [Aphelenchoides besseyi]
MHGKSDVANRNARQATKEQIRMAEVTQNDAYDEDRSRVQKYIKEIIEMTRCTQAQAEIALHDNGNNVEAAVNQILESSNPETWSHYKRKGPKTKDEQNEQDDGFKKGGFRAARRGPFNTSQKNVSGNYQQRDGYRGNDQREGRENRQPRNKEGGGFRGRDQGNRQPRRELANKNENDAWNKVVVENDDDGDDLWGEGKKNLVFNRRENVTETAPQPTPKSVHVPVEEQSKQASAKTCAAGPLSFADVVRKNAQKSAPQPPAAEPVKVPTETRTTVSHDNAQFADSQLDSTPHPTEPSNVLLEPETVEKAPSPISSHAPSAEEQVQQQLTDKLKNDLGLSATNTTAAYSPPKNLHESPFNKPSSSVNAGIVEFVSGDIPSVSHDFQFGFDAGPSSNQQHSLIEDRFQMQPEQISKAPESRPETDVLTPVPDSSGPRANAAAVLNQYVQSQQQQHSAQPSQQHLPYTHQSNQYNRSRNGANNSSSTFNENYPVNFNADARNTYGAPSSPPKSQNISQGLQSQQSAQQPQMAQSQAQQPPHHHQPMYQAAQFPYNFQQYMYSPVPQPGMREDFTSILPYQFNINQMDLNSLTMPQLAVTSAGPIPGHQQQNLGQHTNNHSQSHRENSWLSSNLPPASQNNQPNGHGSQSNPNMNSNQQRQSMMDNNSQNMLGGNAIQPPPGFAPNMAAAPFRAPVFTAYHPPPYMQFPRMLTGLLREDAVALGGVKRKKDQKGDKKRENATPAVDRIPLPPLTLQQAKINAENPPSICLYTILNSSGVCTAAFSDSGENLAVGYRGSEVHVHALNQRVGFRKLKSAEELEALEQDYEDINEEHVYDDNTKTDLLQLSGHVGPVHSVGFSVDKRLLLSGSADETVRLWNLDLRRTLVVYRADAPVWDAQFCDRGLYFAASTARTVALYTTERVYPLRLFSGSTLDVTCVTFHPNCNYVIGGSDDHRIRIWDVLTGECVITLDGHRGVVHSVKVSPDGRTVVSASDDGTLSVWDLTQQKRMTVQDCGSMPFRVPIVFSRDSSVVAVGTPEHAVTFFSMDTATVAYNYSHETRNNLEGFPLLSYPTKKTNLLDLHFVRKNVVIGAGVYDQ